MCVCVCVCVSADVPTEPVQPDSKGGVIAGVTVAVICIIIIIVTLILAAFLYKRHRNVAYNVSVHMKKDEEPTKADVTSSLHAGFTSPLTDKDTFDTQPS